MIKNPKQISWYLLLAMIAFTVGCAERESGQSDALQKKYSIYTMAEDGQEFLMTTDSLSGGRLEPEKSGVKVDPQRIFYDLIVHKGYYYRLDAKTQEFLKIGIENKKFTTKSRLKLEGFSAIDNYNWITPDSLLIIGYDDKSAEVKYAKIHLDSMTAVQGKLNLPAPSGGFNWTSVGFSHFMNGQLLVGYTYHAAHDLLGYTTSDTMYVETLSYPGLKNLKNYKDSRTTYPGGVNTRQSHFFTDENGDFYFITCPGIALGNNPAKPTAIMRIRKSDGSVDPDYFFNISASSIQNNGYGFWYLGKGKAIVRTERKALFTGMGDHYKVPHFDFYEVDLETQTTTRLNLPLDKGTARQCVIVENGIAYIAVNSDSAGNYIWIYNPEKNSLKKGLQLLGQTDYILRIERLN
jgi:hypothetical protein